MGNPEPRAQYLNVVLRLIDRTSLRIPRFQRQFVWGESNVLELLESIKKGYPIGSILTWRVEASDDYFSGFRVETFPQADVSLSNYEVILDGAQRLSTLYGCLRNPTSNSAYEVYYDVRNEEFLHRSAIRKTQAWHVPMHALFNSGSFLTTQRDIAALNDSEDLLRRALDLYSTFQEYQIPIIALSNVVLEDVVEVFRRVNSSGTSLSSVDFVRALTWRSSFDLEETFKSLTDRYSDTVLEGLSDEFLMRCLAITSKLPLDTRNVIRLKKLSDRRNGLANEVKAMERALDRMAKILTRIDIAEISEVPYEMQRLLLFAMMHFEEQVSETELLSWILRSTFAEEYQSKPESYVTRLIAEVQEGKVIAAIDVLKQVDPDLFAQRLRRKGSAVTIGFDLLLRKNGARSLLSGEALSPMEKTYALLYPRTELSSSTGGQTVNVGVLANTVLLNATDAATWHDLRAETSLLQLFAMCDGQTGDAAAIWASQGLARPSSYSDPTGVLRLRSRSLLKGVVADGEATGTPEVAGAD